MSHYDPVNEAYTSYHKGKSFYLVASANRGDISFSLTVYDGSYYVESDALLAAKAKALANPDRIYYVLQSKSGVTCSRLNICKHE